MSINDVEIKEDNLVYDGVFKVKRLNLRFKLFSGAWSQWVFREQIARQDAVAVLLFDPENDEIILVEQIRIGLLDNKVQNPWMLEIVAGLLEDHEDVIATAERESLEEANCKVKTLIPIGDFYNTPGGFTEKTTVFCGIIDGSALGETGGLADEHEDIRIHRLKANEVLKDVESGKLVTSASTLIALLWLKAQRLIPANPLFKHYV